MDGWMVGCSFVWLLLAGWLLLVIIVAVAVVLVLAVLKDLQL